MTEVRASGELIKINHFILLLVLLFFLFSYLPAAPLKQDTKIKTEESQNNLEQILKKCADYCEKLSNVALFFVCKERIHEEVVGTDTSPIKQSYLSRRSPQKLWRKHLSAKTKKEIREYFFKKTEQRSSEYVYDYQLIRKKKNIVEKRILIEKNGKKKDRKNANLETRFAHEKITFGPIALLSQVAQNHHHYKIVKRDVFAGEKVIIIEAIPKDDFILNHLYGKIWIRETDYSVLKIEWYQESVEGYEFLKELAREVKLRPEFILSTEFSFERNGIRFPSKHQLIESYESFDFESRNQKLIKSKKMVEYKDYKFFIVETKVTYIY